MTIKNLIEKYEKSIEGLEEGMSLFDNEGGAVYASFAREIEIYETVIADLQELEHSEPEITNEDIQNAIKQGYKDGYEMAKAKFERPTVLYLCDGYGCHGCEDGTNFEHLCTHTTDITHAKNFEPIYDETEPFGEIVCYAEKEPSGAQMVGGEP